jgi:DNA-binding Lrp family transcriptional regulator
MVNALVLIECEIDRIQEAAREIADLDGVSEVYSVAGEIDLVAIVRVRTHEELQRVIPEGVARVDGVARTETLIAFQVFSRHDLEALFSVGFDGAE